MRRKTRWGTQEGKGGGVKRSGLGWAATGWTIQKWTSSISLGLSDQPELLPVRPAEMAEKTRSLSISGVHNSVVCLAHLWPGKTWSAIHRTLSLCHWKRLFSQGLQVKSKVVWLVFKILHGLTLPLPSSLPALSMGFLVPQTAICLGPFTCCPPACSALPLSPQGILSLPSIWWESALFPGLRELLCAFRVFPGEGELCSSPSSRKQPVTLHVKWMFA